MEKKSKDSSFFRHKKLTLKVTNLQTAEDQKEFVSKNIFPEFTHLYTYIFILSGYISWSTTTLDTLATTANVMNVSNIDWFKLRCRCQAGDWYVSELMLNRVTYFGCWVFRRGIQNWIDFCLKPNISKGNYCTLWTDVESSH